MPDPSDYKDKNSFIDACIPRVIEEGKEPDQATAICNSMWSDKKEKRFCLQGIQVKEDNEEQTVYTGLIATTHPDRVGDILSKTALKQMVDYINNTKQAGDESGSYRSVSLYHDWIHEGDPTLDEAGWLLPTARLKEIEGGHYGVEVDFVVNKFYKGDMTSEEIEYRIKNGGIAGFSIEYNVDRNSTKNIFHEGNSFDFIEELTSFGGVGLARPRMIANPYAVMYKEIEQKAKEDDKMAEEHSVKEEPEQEVSESKKELNAKENSVDTPESNESKPEPEEKEQSSESEEEGNVKEEKEDEKKSEEKEISEDEVSKILESPKFKEALNKVQMSSKTIKKTKEDETMNNVPFNIKEMNSQISKGKDFDGFAYKEAASQFFKENPNFEQQMKSHGIPLRTTLNVKSDGTKLRIVGGFQTKDTLDRDTNSEGTYNLSSVEFADVFLPTLIETFNNQANLFGALPKRDHLEGGYYYGWRLKTDQASSLSVDPDSTTVTTNSVAKEKVRTEIKVYRVGVAVNDYTLYHSRASMPDLLMKEAQARMDDMMRDINNDLFTEQVDTAGNKVLGLAAVADVTGNTSMYGKTRTSANRLRPDDADDVYTTSTGTLTTSSVRGAIRKVEESGTMRRDIRLVTSPTNRDRLFELEDSKQQLSLNPQFGFTGQIAYDGIPVIVDSSCPTDSIFVVDFASEYLVVSKAPQMVGIAKSDASESMYVEVYLAHVYENPIRIHQLDGISA